MPGHRSRAMVLQFGTPDCMVVASARQKIDGEAVRFAEAQRALGRGWQTVARMLGVNDLDLRRACGALKDGDDALALGDPVRRLQLRDQVLAAIAGGADDRAAVAASLGLRLSSVSGAAGWLKTQGLIAGRYKGWRVTPEGQARLAAAMAEVADV